MTAPEPRACIVLDVESTGLDPTLHVPVEVAWINAATGEWGRFLPAVTPRQLQLADPQALEINGYALRLAGHPVDDGSEAIRLHRQLRGNTLAGSNPGFDAAMSGPLFALADAEACFDPGELGPPGPSRPLRLREPWHHRKLDLSAYAAGALGLPGAELPGLAKVCELLGVVNEAPHTALGDCVATLACLRLLGAVPAETQVGGAA